MADTYTLIERISVGAAGASSVTFTSIPQTYTDLKIVCSLRGTRPGFVYQDVFVEFNANTSNYSGKYLDGTGSTVATGSLTDRYFLTMPAGTATTSTFSNNELYIPNYTGSAYKSSSVDEVRENNTTAADQILRAMLWSNTAAITSIRLAPPTDSFAQYSTFYLYGIAKEGVSPAPSSAPYATGGDSIVFDGTYWIHTFTSSGTFTPKKSLSCNYLVVAGGGGGGNGRGGGGGGGGYRNSVSGETNGGGGSAESALSLSSNTAYTVTVGAGGAKGPSTDTTGSDGGNSSISGTGITTITSTGGGGGGCYPSVSGRSGGSGGGAGGGGGSSTGGSVVSPTQGYRGGNISAGNLNGTGGGGAGAQGTDIGGTGSGAGGNGLASSITGSSVTRGGGGGGGGDNAAGAGGTGGGGAGSSSGAATAGTANTGGGGGGSIWSGGGGTAGDGGSGIVIIRYAA